MQRRGIDLVEARFAASSAGQLFQAVKQDPRRFEVIGHEVSIVDGLAHQRLELGLELKQTKAVDEPFLKELGVGATGTLGSTT